jgi:hypothetical protein
VKIRPLLTSQQRSPASCPLLARARRDSGENWRSPDQISFRSPVALPPAVWEGSESVKESAPPDRICRPLPAPTVPAGREGSAFSGRDPQLLSSGCAAVTRSTAFPTRIELSPTLPLENHESNTKPHYTTARAGLNLRDLLGLPAS